MDRLTVGEFAPAPPPPALPPVAALPSTDPSTGWRPSRWRRTSTWVAGYAVVLALIAFWPQPVDSGAGALLKWITTHIPLLTYARIEFGANILLFVPLGVGMALMLPALRYLVMPVALLTSLSIESVQGVLIDARTPSVFDIVANVSGAALGLVAVVVIEVLMRRASEAAR